MEQLELFNIEPIQPAPKRMREIVVGRKRIKRHVSDDNLLMEQLCPEIKKVPYRLSFSPKTQILVPYNWTKQQCLEYEKKYQGVDGKINHDPCSEQSIFGGAASR